MIVNHHTRWGEIGVAVSAGGAGGRARREKRARGSGRRARARVALRRALRARNSPAAASHRAKQGGTMSHSCSTAATSASESHTCCRTVVGERASERASEV